MGHIFALWLAALAQAPASLVPVIGYEAEDQKTSGVRIGPDRRFGTVAAEASGRRAVQLDNKRQSIEIRLKAPAQGLTIRYALPDSPDGRGQDSRAVIEADGRQVAVAALTSRYSHYYGAYPFTNRPEAGLAHHFWDEVRILVPRPLAAGTRLSLRPAPGARGFAVDVVDAESVAPLGPPPAQAVSVWQFGADPTARRSSRQAFIRAIAAARQGRRVLYVPRGRYRVDGHLTVDRVAVTGAGPWHTIIAGHHLGFYARDGGSSDVSLSGFAVESDVTERKDELPLAAIGGRFSRSKFHNLFLHHAKVGLWLDGSAQDLTISNVTIADQAADGINLHRGISRAIIEDVRIRNVGDDGIASWSEEDANSDIVIRRNRVIAPGLANGIALYGGRDIEVSDNWIADTLTQGGGIHLGTRFHSAPFAGRIRIANNHVIRSGSMDPNWHFGVGAIWIYALERPIAAAITLSDNVIEDAGCEAMQLIGPHRIEGVTISGLRIVGGVTTVFALQAPGSLTAERVDSEMMPLQSEVEVPANFRLVRGPGNRNWTTRAVSRVDPPKCI